MSINLLSRWSAKNLIYHNPNDDLESGAWVAMICGLEQSRHSATNQEMAWLTQLLFHDPLAILGAKGAIRDSDAEFFLALVRFGHKFRHLVRRATPHSIGRDYVFVHG